MIIPGADQVHVPGLFFLPCPQRTSLASLEFWISTHALSLDHRPSSIPRVMYLTPAYLCFDHCLLLTRRLDSGLIIFSPSLKLWLQPQKSLPTANHQPSVQIKLFSLKLLLCVAGFLCPNCYQIQKSSYRSYRRPEQSLSHHFKQLFKFTHVEKILMIKCCAYYFHLTHFVTAYSLHIAK